MNGSSSLPDDLTDHGRRGDRGMLGGETRLAAGVVFAATAIALLVAGWVGPDIDVWYGAGLVRAIAERPLVPESLGHVPKFAHLVLLAPAAFLENPEWWLSVVGLAALASLWVAHLRWARATPLDPAILLLVLATIPLVWRATLDGGSVAWGWTCVVVALERLAKGSVRGALCWLASGALFRPEVVGVGIALGAVALARGQRGRAWRLAIGPVLASIAGTAAVDLVWTGRFGASSIAHAVFASASVEQIRGRWGFLDTAHPWWHLSVPLLVAALCVVAWLGMSRLTRAVDRPLTRLPAAPLELLAAAAGFSAVTVANIATGGTLFARFLLPWASVLAVALAMAPWPAQRARRLVADTVLIGASLLAWRVVASEFVGTWPTVQALLVARDVSRRTASELVVSMDAGARAVALGSGARPWKTTPWLLESPETACLSHVIVSRGAFLRRLGDAELARCGPWQDFLVDSAQIPTDVHVLLARRVAR